MIRRACRAALVSLAALAGSVAVAQGEIVRLLEFSDLDGWADDDHAAALQAFRDSCPAMLRTRADEDWGPICALAREVPDAGARAFFERLFRPVLIGTPDEALFTGYFEPELAASPFPTPRFSEPIYEMPPEARRQRPWATRRAIEEDGLLEGRGLEIAWLEDPVEVFFLQVQGSGRLRMPDGRIVRVGYGGKNGHEYRSVGQEMVRRGIYQPHQVSAQVIKNWVRRNPEEGRALLRHNPSYVFFREVTDVRADQGPLGALQVPLTAGRSLAVDPRHTPLGAPVWLEKDGADPIRRLMVAQDTGSAIKGRQRADVFYGSGDLAGRQAGRVRDTGRMLVLLPLEQALRQGKGS